MEKNKRTAGSIIISVPIQQIDKNDFDNMEKSFLLKYHSLPKALVLQFDIDFTRSHRTSIMAKGYAVRNLLSAYRALSLPLKSKRSLPRKLTLPADRLTLGDIIIPWKKLKKHLAGKTEVDLKPVLISNPHIAYTIDTSTYKPSPPAKPNS